MVRFPKRLCRSHCALAASVGVLALQQSALAQSWVVEKVAHSSDPAPDAQGPLNILMLQGVSRSGAVCFNAATLPSVSGSTRQIVYLWKNGVFTTVASADLPAPGQPAGTNFMAFNARPTADGRAAVQAFLTGSSVTTANDTSLWLGAGSGLGLIAREGSDAPGIPGATMSQISGWLMASDDGSFVQRAFLAGANVTMANDSFILHHAAGISQPLVREGDPMPGGLPGTVAVIGGQPVVADGGIALFTLSGSQTQPALVYGTPGSLQVLARTGVTLPGLPAGQVMTDASLRYAIARNGRVAFAAGTGGPQGVYQGVWVGVPGNLSMVIRSGVAAPGLPAGYTVVEANPSNYPPALYVGSNGHAAVLCGVRNGNGPFELALYRVTDAGAPELVAFSGTVIGGEAVGQIDGASVQVDGAGNISFVGGGIGFTLFSWSHRSGLQRVVGHGDVLSVGMSVPRTVLNLSTESMFNASIGRHGVATEDGRVAVHAQFTDATTGIFLARIPGTCGDVDFNNDGLFPDTQDIADLLAVFGGGACPTPNCDSIDFNNDGLLPDTDDVGAFLRVFGGGPC
ncbi:MAG TPA: choice-of-anchor tandem repeat NxxGxxAF-containing protein [Phycisphaerales bacterium]|nr:choice-of-anchor tandem repeat NxxGxxAF-containing protein [Phycisphaerales bacterium]